MKKLHSLLFIVPIAIGISSSLLAQNVGINTTGALPNASAILDLSNSASMALLTPQVSLADVTFLAPVPGPGPAGLIVYNTNPTTNGGSGTGFYYWDGAKWNNLLTGSNSGWSLTGNTGTNPAINYLGTNDPEDLVFKTFSTERMRITAAGGVGISTTTPQNALDVSGAEAIGAYAGVNSAPSNGLIVSGRAGFGTNAPDPSAAVDITSATNGFLVPRMTTAQMNAIVSPALALMIYNTTVNCFMFYTGSSWESMACICKSAPNAPGNIGGNVSVCTGAAGITYTVAAVSGATSYTWTVPSGAAIAAGQGTTSIAVNFGGDSGYVSVTASNSCGTSPATTLAISINTAPNAPGSISGDTNPGINTSYTYSVLPVSGALSYKWSLTGTGASIASGQGTASISIAFGATAASYTLCVYDSNACGISKSSCLNFTSIACSHGSQTFTYTGAVQTFTVPSCISSITVIAYGAQGGGGNGGLGGEAIATVPVSGGAILDVYVGGNPSSQIGPGGFNGGGASTIDPCGGPPDDGFPGGGASDVRITPYTLADRVIVGGGGGGQGWSSGVGGSGGGLTGGDGQNNWNSAQGFGGTQAAGGAGGSYSSDPPATSGSFGQGGEADTYNGYCQGSGGGGGYYGGGGGFVAAGGGGSSFVGYAGNTNTSTTSGVNAGNGSVTVTW